MCMKSVTRCLAEYLLPEELFRVHREACIASSYVSSMMRSVPTGHRLMPRHSPSIPLTCGGCLMVSLRRRLWASWGLRWRRFSWSPL